MDKHQSFMPIGTTIDNLQIVGYAPSANSTNSTYYKCRCTICGREKLISPYNFRTHIGTTHRACSTGLHAETKGKFYNTWRKMKKNNSFPGYENFVDFYDDTYQSFIDGKAKYGDVMLRKIDENRAYERGNVEWVDKSIKNYATRTVRRIVAISPDNTLYYLDNVSEFARMHGMHTSIIYEICKGNRTVIDGWTFIDINSLSNFVINT